MKLLLITLGGAIDTIASVQPHPNILFSCSQALHSLYRLSEDRPQTDTLDHIAINKSAAPAVDSKGVTRLVDMVKAMHDKFDRIVATMPSEQAEDIAYSVSRYIFKVACPIVMTGAELPNPKDFATNALSNLKLAAFGPEKVCPLPMIYFAEGEELVPAMPDQTRFQRSRPIRATFSFRRPYYPPLGQPVCQKNRAFDR